MSVNNKNLATILLGAAAAFGAYKYTKLTDEEKQQMADSFKDKFHKLKEEAESAGDTAKNYFTDLKNKVTDMFKDHFPAAEQHFEEFFEEKPDVASSPTTTEVNPGA